jgi:hypothetical protein
MPAPVASQVDASELDNKEESVHGNQGAKTAVDIQDVIDPMTDDFIIEIQLDEEEVSDHAEFGEKIHQIAEESEKVVECTEEPPKELELAMVGRILTFLPPYVIFGNMRPFCNQRNTEFSNHPEDDDTGCSDIVINTPISKVSRGARRQTAVFTNKTEKLIDTPAKVAEKSGRRKSMPSVVQNSAETFEVSQFQREETENDDKVDISFDFSFEESDKDPFDSDVTPKRLSEVGSILSRVSTPRSDGEGHDVMFTLTNRYNNVSQVYNNYSCCVRF